jgi:hypothetical protein
MFYTKLMQPHGPDSNFFWCQRDDSCWIEDNNVLLVIHTKLYLILPQLSEECLKLQRLLTVLKYETW